MASITTAQVGDWEDPATWTGNAVPVASTDKAIINHTVTVTASVAAGDGDTSDIEDAALQINANLIIEEDVFFEIRGNVKAQHFVDLARGAQIISNQATDAQWYHSANGMGAALRIAGEAGQMCIVQAVGAGCLYFEAPLWEGPGTGRMEAQHVQFIGLGSDANQTAIQWDHRNSDGDAHPFFWRDCLFDNCYAIAEARIGDNDDHSTGNTGSFEFVRCEWDNCQAPFPVPNDGDWGNLGVNSYYGCRGVVDSCDFPGDSRVFFNKPNDIEVRNCVFRTGDVTRHTGSNTYTVGKFKAFTDNLFMFSGDGLSIVYGEHLADNMFVCMNDANNNPHFGACEGGSGVTRATGNMFSSVTTLAGSEGDGWFPQDADSGTRASNVLEMDGNITLPTAAGFGNDAHSATLYSYIFTTSNVSAKAVHNTMNVSRLGGINAGENENGDTGCIGPTRGNAFIGRAGEPCYKIEDRGLSQTDIFLEADVCNNAGFNLVSGSKSPGGGYDNFSHTLDDPIGVDDVDDINPQFVDTSRQPWTWVDPTHTPAQGMTAAADRLSLGASGYKMADMMAYLRNGYRPQAEEYRKAGNALDGTRDLGAVPMAPATPALFEFAFGRDRFLSWHPLLPSLDTFIANVEAEVTITANLVSPKHLVLGGQVVLYFDAELTDVEKAAVIAEAETLGLPA